MDVSDLSGIPARSDTFEDRLIGGLPRNIVQRMQLMNIDLTALRNASAAHTQETQRLLDGSAGAAKAFNEAQTEVDGLASEIASQTAAIKAFNDANQAKAS